MHRNRYIYIIALFAVMLTSCIKPYEPVIESKDASKYVVSGQVVKGEDVQLVNVSVTSPISKPEYIPVTGCQVTISDDKGNNFEAADQSDGNYTFHIPDSYLSTGTPFMIKILTPAGINIVSDFDTLNECPEVDSVYYTFDDIPTTDPEVFKKGLQFYIDLNAENTSSHNFRWEAIETWEYHSVYPIEWYYDGTIHHVYPPDYSRMVCWRTEMVKNIFTLSTENLEQNAYKFFPLHFVDNYSSPRLVYGYSLLISQFALSNAAYSYWEKLRINSSDQGGLYDKQPLAIRGNLHNETNQDQDVLGFFGVTAVKSKRIFVSNIPNEYVKDCAPIAMRGLFELTPGDYPAYLYGDETGYSLALLIPECVDCLVSKGTNVKPDFWP
jgi:hypothetical protein